MLARLHRKERFMARGRKIADRPSPAEKARLDAEKGLSPMAPQDYTADERAEYRAAYLEATGEPRPGVPLEGTAALVRTDRKQALEVATQLAATALSAKAKGW